MTTKSYISSLCRSILVAGTVCVSGFSAYAADVLTDGMEVFANTDYECPPGFDQIVVKFVSTSDSPLTYVCGSAFSPYYDEACTQECDRQFLNYSDIGTYQTSVSKGQTLYFKYINPYYGGSIFRILQDAPLALNEAGYEEGSALPLTSGFSTVYFIFNQPAKATKATLSCGEKSVNPAVSSAYSDRIEVEYLRYLQDWMADGTAKPGDEIKLRLEGIQNENGALLNETGVLEASYKVPVEAVNLVKYTTPFKFLSYWNPGDPAAVMTAEYDGPIGKAQYIMTFGNPESENNDFYAEIVSSTDANSNIRIEGNLVYIDFSGKQRRPQDMVPTGTNYSNLALKVTAWDTNGNPIISPGQGKVGSFDAQDLTYSYIAPAVLNPTFNPPHGSSLKAVTKLEININDYSKIDFTGVKFDIEGSEPIIVAKNAVTITESVNSAKLVVNVPRAAQTGDAKVIVTLDGLTCSDGVDHSNDVRAVYDGFAIEEYTYYNADGQIISSNTLPTLAKDSKFELLVNVADQYQNLYMEYTVDEVLADGSLENVKSYAWLNRGKDEFGFTVYTAVIPRDIKLLLGHTYRVTFTAWESEDAKRQGVAPLGVEYYDYNGSTAPFEYSSIAFTNSNPTAESEIEKDLEKVTLYFDGMVSINKDSSFINIGQGMTENFSKVTAIDPDPDYGLANTWEFYIPASYWSWGTDALEIVVVASDIDGKLVQGNFGSEETTAIKIAYPIIGASVTEAYHTDPASDSYLESLKVIDIAGDNGTPMGIDWNASKENQIRVYRGTFDRELLQSFTTDDVEEVRVLKPGVTLPEGGNIGEWDDNYYTTVIRVTLTEEYTKEGEYVMVVPQGIFQVGSQFEARLNAAMTFGWTIGAAPTPVEVRCEPAEGSVEEIGEFKLFSEAEMLNSGKATLTINGGSAINLDDPTPEYDPNDYWGPPMYFVQTLPETYTANGTYVINYPAGFFTDGNGDPMGPITVTYLIGTVAVDSIFADEENINVYTFDGRVILVNGTADDIKALAPGYYIINGKKYVIK